MEEKGIRKQIRRTMKKIITSVLAVFFLFVFSGCTTGDWESSAEAYHPLSEEEVIEYVRDMIYKETGDEVDVRITETEDLRAPIVWAMDNSPVAYTNVENGHYYKMIVENGDVRGIAEYSDGYIVYYNTDGGATSSINDAVYWSDYPDNKSGNVIRDEFAAVLDETFDEYYLYPDVGNSEGLDIFICSSDYEKLDELFDRLNNICLKYSVGTRKAYTAYIYKDEEAFQKKDFEIYPNILTTWSQPWPQFIIEAYTDREVTCIVSGVELFDRTLFETDGAYAVESKWEHAAQVDVSSFDYVIVCYECEADSNWGLFEDFEIFGVK